MDVFYAYTYSTAAWLGVQALALLLAPKVVLSMVADKDGHIASDLEIYLCRSLGFSLIAIALVVLFFTGTIPLSMGMTEPVNLDDLKGIDIHMEDPHKAPYAEPIIRVTTLYHTTCGTYCYLRWLHAHPIACMLGAVGYGLLAVVGGWCMIFGGVERRVSKRTSADKRTAGYPFKNVNAYDKKEDRKQI